MKYKHLSTLILIAMMHSPAWAASIRKEKPVRQVSVQRIDSMPDMPGSYRMIDWKAKAKAFDAYVFDWNNTDKMGPLIWKDDARRNVDQTTFGLYTAIGDVRQGPDNNGGEFHEALNSMAAILGAGLCGIDKTSQNGYNYVRMLQNYFNRDNGWNIVMNNTNPPCLQLGRRLRKGLVV